MARKYNYIYSQLVKTENDMVGLIAYSIYKSGKIAFIEDFKKKNNGQEPSEKEFATFNASSSTPAALEGYMAQATTICERFAEKLLESTTEQIEKDCREELNSKLTGIIDPLVKTSVEPMLQDAIEPLKPCWKSFGMGVLQSVAGAVCFALLIPLLAVIVEYSDYSMKFSIEKKGTTTEQTVQDSVPTVNVGKE